MRTAYIITAHKAPDQLLRLIERLNTNRSTFLVHVDKGTDERTHDLMVGGLRHLPNVHFMQQRFKCHYMTLFSGVQAVAQGIVQLLQANGPFDYLIYLTGQDYPIKTNEQIETVLKNANGRSYVMYLPLPYEGTDSSGARIVQNASRFECWHLHPFGSYLRLPLRGSSRFCRAVNLLLPQKRKFPKGFKPYGGGAYWCLARRHVEYLHEFLTAHPAFLRFFRFVKSADEICFQTILINSPVSDQIINDDLRYVDWSTNDCHPKVLRAEDLGRLIHSPKLFARKFDSELDAKVLDLIDEKILKIVPHGKHSVIASG